MPKAYSITPVDLLLDGRYRAPDQECHHNGTYENRADLLIPRPLQEWHRDRSTKAGPLLHPLKPQSVVPRLPSVPAPATRRSSLFRHRRHLSRLAADIGRWQPAALLKFVPVVVDGPAAELCLRPSQAADGGIRLVRMTDDLVLAYVDSIRHAQLGKLVFDGIMQTLQPDASVLVLVEAVARFLRGAVKHDNLVRPAFDTRN